MSGRTFAEFFAGIGLVRLALEGAGWRGLFANDIDEKKFEMYEDNFDGAALYLVEDVHRLSASQVPDVTLWWASFPCTDLSLAGYRKGLAGVQSGALLGFLRLLDEKDGQRPPLVALENVTGFLTSHRGEDFAATIRELNRLGYSCDAFVLDAIHFVPQSRPRLFVIGMYDCPETKDVAAALASRHQHLATSQLRELITGRSDLRWTVLNMPPPPRQIVRLRDVLQRLPSTSRRWWSEDRVEYLLNQMSPRHSEIVKRLRGGGIAEYATVYRRVRYGKSMAELRCDGIAGCLRTPRGGSSRQILLVAGKGRIRARFVTPRECARLMGAPHYRIKVPDNQAYFGFGDAVCVPAVQWVADLVLTPLLGSAGHKPAEIANVHA
jgi:DNA (cytosine-5)-methyltransferase 1